MTAQSANRLASFSSSLLDSSRIRCPECREVSPLGEWSESEVYCEDCGSHPAHLLHTPSEGP